MKRRNLRLNLIAITLHHLRLDLLFNLHSPKNNYSVTAGSNSTVLIGRHRVGDAAYLKEIG
jgi:hypothetical protein